MPRGGGTRSEAASKGAFLVETCRSPPHHREGDVMHPRALHPSPILQRLAAPELPGPILQGTALAGAGGRALPCSRSSCELLAVTSMARTSCLKRLCSLLLWAFITVIFLPMFSIGDVSV